MLGCESTAQLRERVLRGLKGFEGSFESRLRDVRDTYAYYCAALFANGLINAAKEYAEVFQYCNTLLHAYRARWEFLNLPKQGGRL